MTKLDAVRLKDIEWKVIFAMPQFAGVGVPSKCKNSSRATFFEQAAPKTKNRKCPMSQALAVKVAVSRCLTRTY